MNPKDRLTFPESTQQPGAAPSRSKETSAQPLANAEFDARAWWEKECGALWPHWIDMGGIELINRAYAAGRSVSGGQPIGAANPVYWEGYNDAIDEWELKEAAPAGHAELSAEQVIRASVVANSKAMSSGRYYQIFTQELNELLAAPAGHAELSADQVRMVISKYFPASASLAYNNSSIADEFNALLRASRAGSQVSGSTRAAKDGDAT